MNKTDLKELDKSQLIGLLIKISKLNKENAAFLQSNLSKNFEDLYELSRKKIDKAFCCYELISLKDARQALADFQKANPPNSRLIELHLYYIQRAYILEETDWRFGEKFYSAIENIFRKIIELIKKDLSLKEKYCEKIENIIKQANEGWAHQDTLKEIYAGIN